jgi:hypothetical protein
VYVVCFGNALELILTEADLKLAFQDGNRRRYRAALSDDLFEATRRLKILRARQPVRDDGRFKRDDGAAFVKRRFDFRAQIYRVRFHKAAKRGK